ncbi:MAG: TrmH family RNA methyltransferase [Pseudomonadota bacterium]
MNRTSTIDSASNPRFRSWLRQIEGSRRLRDADLTLVAGQKIVCEVLEHHPGVVRYVLVLRASTLGELPEFPTHAEVVYLAPSLFREMDLFGTRSPLLLVAKTHPEPWEPAAAANGAWVGIPFQDPVNVGAVIRSAAALGAAGAVLLPGASSPWHPKAIRASAGAVFSVPLFRAEVLPATAEITVVALDARGDDIRGYTFPERFLLLAGVEGPGLPEDLAPTTTLALPMTDRVESLNAMVATSLALYEWARSSTTRSA